MVLIVSLISLNDRSSSIGSISVEQWRAQDVNIGGRGGVYIRAVRRVHLVGSRGMPPGTFLKFGSLNGIISRDINYVYFHS